MKKNILTMAALMAFAGMQAQIQTNNGTVNGITNSNVLLDGSSGFSTEAGAGPYVGKGLIIPSVDLVNFQFDLSQADGFTFPTYFDGMIVYNNATGNTLTTGNRPSTSLAVTPGYYYFSNPNGASNGNITGGQWKALGGTAAAQNIYNSNGALDGNRIITADNYSLTISPTTASGLPSSALLRLGNTDYSAQTNKTLLSLAPGMFQIDAPGIAGGRFIVDGSGNVGVGTATPAAKLDVAGAIKSSSMSSNTIILNGAASGSLTQAYFDGLGRLTAGTTYTGTNLNSANNGLTATSGNVQLGGILTKATTVANNGNPITFAGSSTGTTFTSVGNVGVGTPNPISTLDVIGNFNITPTAISAIPATGLVRIGNTDYSAQTNKTLLSLAPGIFQIDAPGIAGGRFIIDGTGKVGIGINSPAANLDVVGSINASEMVTVRKNNGGYALLQSVSASNSGHLSIHRANGSRIGYIGYDNVNLGYTAESGAIHVFNTTIQTPRVQGPSDRRFKKDITPIYNATEKLNQLNGYTYTWKDKKEFPGQTLGEGKDMGVIAQEVEKVFPDAVQTNKDGYKSVNYNALIPVLIEALKESNKKIQALEDRLNGASAPAETSVRLDRKADGIATSATPMKIN